MKRITVFFLALALALGYTVWWGAPAVLGRLGPCVIRVHCPMTDGATRYYYELEGPKIYRSIRVDYIPGRDGSGAFRDLPPGDYTLRCAGVFLGNFTVTLTEPMREVWPTAAWPVSPPK